MIESDKLKPDIFIIDNIQHAVGKVLNVFTDSVLVSYSNHGGYYTKPYLLANCDIYHPEEIVNEKNIIEQ